MKSKYLIIISALAIAACAREEAGPENTGLKTFDCFTATVEDSEQTKVHMENVTSVKWDEGDCIGVFSDTQPPVPFYKGADGKFRGAKITGTQFYAFYPYEEGVYDSANPLVLKMPSGFVLPMIAKASDNNLVFKQTGGLLHFTITGTVTLNSVTLKGNNGEQIGGTFSVNLGDDAPELSGEVTTETLVYTPASPVQLSSSEGYEISFILPPVTFEGGFSLTVNYGEEASVTKKTTKTVTLSRASIRKYSLVNLDELIEEETSWMMDAVPPDNEIWYTTEDNSLISFDTWANWYPEFKGKPFDRQIISHTYENGKGIIKCDGPITIIYDHVFGNGLSENINHIALPNSIRILHTGALEGIGVEELRIPDNLQLVDTHALKSKYIKRFIGRHTSTDGKCVIIEKGFMSYYGNTQRKVQNYMAAFAQSGVSEYSLPSNVEILGWDVFAGCSELRKISFNEGLKEIMGDCFVDVNLDCEIVLPSTLESIDYYAFRACTGIKGFYGNEKFHTSDHLCLTFEQTGYSDEPEKNGTWINRFCGTELEHYDVPEGIKGIENYSFDNLPNLRSVSFPSTLAEIGSSAFYRCANLETLYGGCVSEDHRAIVWGTHFAKLVATKGITKYVVPDGITTLGYHAFADNTEIEEIIVSDSVTQLGGYDFAFCNKLKKIVLSSNLNRVDSYNPFLQSNNLEEIYFRSYLPPTYSDTQFDESDNTHLTIYVPEETLELYKESGWYQYAPYMVGYKYNDISEWDPDFYVSTDYTADGAVTVLQQSTVGTGIDLILMGDAFSDRQIADGTYTDVIEKAVDSFFSEEPYKSMRDFFNVYVVNVVSLTESYEHGGQTLGTRHGNGTYVYGRDSKVVEYAKKAVGEERLDDAVIVVLMNEDAYAGTCVMYHLQSGDYGRGLSIAYFPTSNNPDTFNGLVTHEAGGHGFAKLADEYAYEDMGAVPQNEIASVQEMAQYGWWKNVDFTSDPVQVKWGPFISDERYASEKIGCYEGGLTYWTGVWRPTENSIMRYNTDGFNAPSRYAIWYRINKLAYGEDWNGTYEDFVTFDQAHHQATASTKSVTRNYVEKQLPPLAPPVVVNKDWRELLSK